MQSVENPDNLQKLMLEARVSGKTIGFVPTMGNLHQGHLSLVKSARQKADLVVVSIFVNPMQFGPNEDFDAYPRTLKSDAEKLEASGVDYLFTPTINDIYPDGKDTHASVEVNRMTDKLCGASRPGHFRGVTTVVNILFNIVQPHFAVFGKKDYQQFLIIKAMVRDLRMPIEIIGGDILRETNGLAMSSRNGYLTMEEKDRASQLQKTLQLAASELRQGKTIKEVESEGKNRLQSHGFRVDYLEVVRRENLQPAQTDDRILLIAAAAWLGRPRLIDNIEVEINKAQSGR